MENKLPLYKIKVNPNDESGVYQVSLVDEPAIEENWIKLSKQVELKFSADKDKQLLYGPMLIPNKLIYRRDDDGYEYNIMFDEETIELIAEKFKKNKFNDQFNFQHSDISVKAFLKEDWIISNPDKSNQYGFDLPNGTWFASVKIEDSEFWDKYVKGEEVKGFSVEIMAGAELVELSINNKINKTINLMKIKTNEGVDLYLDGELLEGVTVFVNEEMTELAPEGAHMLEDGQVITLDENGVILSIATETPEIEEEEELSTEEVVLEEEVINEEPFEGKVMLIVQPALDAILSQQAELLNKLAELESKLAEKDGVETELKTQIEKLSSMAGAESITKKNDNVKVKLQNELSEKINIFRQFR